MTFEIIYKKIECVLTVYKAKCRKFYKASADSVSAYFTTNKWAFSCDKERFFNEVLFLHYQSLGRD